MAPSTMVSAKSVQLSILVDPELFARLHEHRKATGVAISQFGKRALVRALDEAEATKRDHRKKGTSAQVV